MAPTPSIGSCIIVGGGPGGITVAKTLQKTKKNVDVTVVDRQDYLDWSLASPRSLVSPGDIKKMGYVMPLTSVCEFVGAKFVHKAVTSVTATSVTLEDGTVLQADTVVVAMGGQYASALWKPLASHTTAEKRIAAFEEQNKLVQEATNIVVAGAGLAGTEVAGELKAAFPDKTVTLVGSFLTAVSDAKRAKVRQALEKLDVQLKEGRVEETEPDANKQVTTSKGETLDADLILSAAGFVYAGAKLLGDDATLKESVTDRGQLACKATLQLKTSDTVFAVGDICAVPEGCYADVKGTMHAENTAKTVAANIVKLLAASKDDTEPKLQDFKWATKPVQVPCMTALGPKVGIADMGLPGFMAGLGNFMCRKFKCGDYYMSMQGAGYGKGKTWN